jgi:hypothetical protein
MSKLEVSLSLAREEFASLQRAFDAAYAPLAAKRSELEGRRAALGRETAANASAMC